MMDGWTGRFIFSLKVLVCLQSVCMYLHLLESLGRVGGGDMRPRGDDDGGGFNSLALRLQAFCI